MRLRIGRRLPAIAALLAAAIGGLAGAGTAGAAEASEAAEGGVLVWAMRDELARSMSGLRIEGMAAPYFVEYAVEERLEHKVSAVLGALEKQESRRSRHVRVGVRVGSRESDNTGFVSASSFFGFGGPAQWLPLDDDYAALRRGLWLATDAAYRQALGQLAAKRAALQNRKPEEIPDLSLEDPVTLELPAKAEAFDEAAWAERVRALSAVYRSHPGIQESRVSLRVARVVRTYVNSEGTLVRRPADTALLLAGTRTQAGDGLPLHGTLSFFETRVAHLPGQEVLAAAVRHDATRLELLARAPATGRYVGPVLFAPQAAAQLVALALLPAFSGERPPLSDDQEFSSLFRPGAFSGRVGRRVLPEFLSVEDDPSREQLDGRTLFGSYAVDDQGVPAQRVSLVEQGVLKGLLMSRRPGYGISRSNGHGRSVSGEAPRAAAGNLILAADGGRSYEELKEDLLERCRKEGHEYGLVVTSVGVPPQPDFQSSLFALLLGGSEAAMKVAAVDATRIFVADGREEPVRGLSTGDLTPRAFLEIAAAGSERHVLNLLSAEDGSVMGGLKTFAVSSSDGHATGVPTSVAAPALLFPELEFVPSDAPGAKLPLAARPALE